MSLAAALHGARFTGTRRLKVKESDRGEAMASELLKLGIKTDLYDNEIEVHSDMLQAPTEPIDGHNDHRIVMAMSLLLTLKGGEIEGAEAVAKSYPNYFEDIEKLGNNIEVLSRLPKYIHSLRDGLKNLNTNSKNEIDVRESA